MKLYHGTNGGYLGHILKAGIRPRGPNGRTNWKESVESNPRCVYLTDCYAPHFAMNAARGKVPSCAIVEIDTDRLDPGNLYPDEDFLEQIGRDVDGVPGTMAQRTRFYRRQQFTYDWPCSMVDGSVSTWWRASLHHLGTCSHRGVIPASAITRAVSWPHEPNVWLGLIWDCSISLLNRQHVGERYQRLTRKLFEGEFDEDRPKAPPSAEAAQAWFINPPLPAIEGYRRIVVTQKDATDG
jgi:hypothetical protein